MSLRRNAPAWLVLALSVLLSACPGSEEDHLCGNGVVEAGETCDDGNTNNDDACSNLCTVSVCGNGTIEPGEQCDDGNTTSGDGCEATCRITTAATTCDGAESLEAPSSGSCAVTAGTNGSVLITGVVLGDGETFVGGQVLYDAAGALQCVGCGCDTQAGAAEATQLVCPEVVVSPGLINAHDHLTFQNPPYVPTTDERWEHRHDWRQGQNNHTNIQTNMGGTTNTDGRIWAELRQVMAGTTSLNGSGNSPGLMRNLDQSSHLLGLDIDPVLYETFPLGGSDQRIASCSYQVSGPDSATGAYTPHVAEGIEESARNELRCLYGTPDAPGFADLSRTAVIHAVGATATEAAWLATGGASVIWSPRTNVSLYGDTTPIPVFHRLGVNVGMGTDWLYSGSMNMLRELQCADLLNQSYWGQALTDEDLWRIATVGGADALKVGHRIGRLKSGHVADLALFTLRSFAENPHRAVITASPSDVVLTVRGGKALYGDANLTAALRGGCAALDVCGSAKEVCLEGEDITKSFAQLQTSQATAYGLFACGTPVNEPTCVPSRTSTNASWPASTFGSSVYSGLASAGDQDGDGVPDAEDNCAGVFNPIRPMDFGKQADVDGDGLGDLCDPCPLNAGTTCTGLVDGDRDGDGVPDAQDVCPLVGDDQSDADGDGKGDACDLCPTANPGEAICSVGIADFKQPVSHTVLLSGEQVEVKNVIVTGLVEGSSGGFYVQERAADPVTGFAHRGLFVFAPATPASPWATPISVGDVVDLTGQVTVYFGQIQLQNATWSVVSNAVLPDPVVVTTEQVATGTALAQELEGVLVRVEGVAVTDIAPPAGSGDSSPTGEFVVTSDGLSTGLRVDNFLYPGLALPELELPFDAITGVLTFRHNHSKLEPRDAADLALGPVRVKSLLPATTFARVGVSGATVPEALTVTLDRVVAADTVVTVASEHPDLLTVGAVTVLAGQSSATVPVTGVAVGEATVTATLPDAPVRSAVVEVLEANQAATLVDLTGSASTVAVGSDVTFTLILDVPAAVATSIGLTSSAPASLAVPASVSVAADQLSVSFTATAGTPGSATITATLGAVTETFGLTVVEPSVGGLVINEVDYDQTEGDTTEFAELLNAGNTPISLIGKQLRFVNGSGAGSEYFVLNNAPIELSMAGAELAAGQYLLVHTAAVVVPAGVLSIPFVPIAGGSIQNGAPDALGIWDTVTQTWVDRLSYEGDAKLGGSSMQEGPVATTGLADPNFGDGSLSRLPNGVDTDVNGDDFVVFSTPTPGAANVP